MITTLYFVCDNATQCISTHAIIQIEGQEVEVILDDQKLIYSAQDPIIVSLMGARPTIYFENDEDYLYVLDMLRKITEPPIPTFTCTKRNCAYAHSHVSQSDNKDCRKCDNMNKYVSLGAVLYVAKHIDGQGSADWARRLVNEGKKFTMDGELIND